jgi:hypothetical protein
MCCSLGVFLGHHEWPSTWRAAFHIGRELLWECVIFLHNATMLERIRDTNPIVGLVA